MPLSGHLDVLSDKHRVLEQRLEQALAHPSVSDGELAEIKREKLRIKDEIQRLKGTNTEH
ncbi:MAG: YdcH family protein [Hyphomicrobiaceae bacterium]